MIHHSQFNFLPGKLHFAPGRPADYRTLERFHYLPSRPATWAGVWVARFNPHKSASHIVGVVVLSFPSAVQRARHRVFDLAQLRYGEKLRFVNANLRTISRVIVHPQFRSVGLAHALIDCAIRYCPTRYIEASARMGKAHPMFERAGMIRVDPDAPDQPVYYWMDRFVSRSPVFSSTLPTSSKGISHASA